MVYECVASCSVSLGDIFSRVAVRDTSRSGECCSVSTSTTFWAGNAEVAPVWPASSSWTSVCCNFVTGNGVPLANGKTGTASGSVFTSFGFWLVLFFLLVFLVLFLASVALIPPSPSIPIMPIPPESFAIRSLSRFLLSSSSSSSVSSLSSSSFSSSSSTTLASLFSSTSSV